MNRLRELAPWQIILLAFGVLTVCAIAGYFLVTKMTTVKTGAVPPPTVPGNLADIGGGQLDKQTKILVRPAELSADLIRPIATPDPNNPSTVNPFR